MLPEIVQADWLSEAAGLSGVELTVSGWFGLTGLDCDVGVDVSIEIGRAHV